MKLPIPDDWDGLTWRSVCVEFPDSVQWLAFFNGFLSQWRRGRLWDENTGSILDVLAIGAEIWERNSLLPTCEGTPTPPEVITIIRRCAASAEAESEALEMGCEGSGLPIKIEGGKLYWWHCCDWALVGTVGGDPESVDPGFEDDITPTPTLSACGKAKAIVDAIYTVSQAMFEATDDNFWEIIGNVKDACPGISLKDKYIVEGVIDALALKEIDYTEEEIFDADTWQGVLCRLVNSMTASTDELTDADFDHINTAFNQNMGFEVAIFGAAANAIGKSQLSNIAQTGALNTTADCECPDPLDLNPTVDWEGYTWKHYWNFKADNFEWIASNVLTEYVAGQGWVDWADAGTAYAKTAIEIPLLHEDGVLGRVWIKFHVGTGFDYSGDLWKIQTDTGNIDQAVPGGDPVSVGGDIIFDKLEPRNFVGTDNRFALIIEGHVDGVSGATDPDSPRVIGIALAGTGTDSFVV